MYRLPYDFWIPEYKGQYVDWLSRHYPNDSEGKKINWSKFKKSALQAIYIKRRINEESEQKRKEEAKRKEEKKELQDSIEGKKAFFQKEEQLNFW